MLAVMAKKFSGKYASGKQVLRPLQFEMMSWSDGVALFQFYDESGEVNIIYISPTLMAWRTSGGIAKDFDAHPQPYPGWLPVGWARPVNVPYQQLTYHHAASGDR